MEWSCMGVSRLSSSSVTLADAIGMVVRDEGQKSPLMRPIHNPRFSKLTRIVSRHELDPGTRASVDAVRCGRSGHALKASCTSAQTGLFDAERQTEDLEPIHLRSTHQDGHNPVGS